MSTRDRALLRAVGVGRAELVCGCVPHLLVDGLHVCDQDTHALAGLIAPAIPGRVGMRVLAVLTDAGQQALADAEVTACAPAVASGAVSLSRPAADARRPRHGALNRRPGPDPSPCTTRSETHV